MSYDLYPAVDEDLNFAPEIRAALAKTFELRNTVVPMTNTQRNNLSGTELWEGRLIFNTTTARIDRYDAVYETWVQVSTDHPGVVKEYCGDTAPPYHVMANGGVYPRTGIYAALFAVCGTRFNIGGEAGTHFRVLNKAGYTSVGVDAGDGNINAVGEKYGLKTHTLTTAEMPTHSHAGWTGTDGGVDHLHSNSITAVGDHVHGTEFGDQAIFANGTNTRTHLGSKITAGGGGHSHGITNGASDRSLNHAHAVGIGNAGSGGAHNNMQPSVAMNFIIAL